MNQRASVCFYLRTKFSRGFPACQRFRLSSACISSASPALPSTSIVMSTLRALLEDKNDPAPAMILLENCNEIARVPFVSSIMWQLEPLNRPLCPARLLLTASDEGAPLSTELLDTAFVLRLEPERCIALFNHRKPALLYKLAPEELPGFNDLKPCRIVNYKPEWKRREDAAARKRGKQAKPKPAQAQHPQAPPPAQAKEEKKTRPPKDKHPAKPIPADDPPPAIPNYGGIGMVPMSAVLSAEDEDDSDDLPRR